MLSTSFVPISLEWVREHHKRNCPQHGGTIPPSYLTAHKFCPICKRFWRMRRTGTGHMWFFVTLSKDIQEAVEQLKGKLSGDTGNS
jgi:hypothetical protein